jgi:hypothetical protein
MSGVNEVYFVIRFADIFSYTVLLCQAHKFNDQSNKVFITISSIIYLVGNESDVIKVGSGPKNSWHTAVDMLTESSSVDIDFPLCRLVCM